jgi:hypothetical protein
MQRLGSAAREPTTVLRATRTTHSTLSFCSDSAVSRCHQQCDHTKTNTDSITAAGWTGPSYELLGACLCLDGREWSTADGSND